MLHNTSKNFINSAATCVNDSIQGLLKYNTLLCCIDNHSNILVRKDLPNVKADTLVTILTGGGSGHEPFGAGYIGQGMATCHVAGHVFASPSAYSVQSAINALASGSSAGVLVIINNYTGDRLNFGIAIEKAKASGLDVEMIINADDCAVTSPDRTTGRRGLAGIILLLKIAGALAEESKPLSFISHFCKAVMPGIGTISACLKSCNIPGVGSTFSLGPNELSLGLGIHGEAGAQCLPLASANEIAKTMIDYMINKDNTVMLDIKAGDHLVILVNNLGGVSQLELSLMVGEFVAYLEQLSVVIDRCFCGSFITSLDMQGISLTVLNMRLCQVERESILHCLDAPTMAPSWIPFTPVVSTEFVVVNPLNPIVSHLGETYIISKENVILLKAAVRSICNALKLNANKLNELDKTIGDGDTGSTMADGAECILNEFESLHWNSPFVLFAELSSLVEKSMGGCSGAIYSLLLTAFSKAFRKSFDGLAWTTAMHDAVATISLYGGAHINDRTMLDALAVLRDYLRSVGSDNLTSLSCIVQQLIPSLDLLLERNKSMRALSGRASYVDPELVVGTVDPGTAAVAMMIKSLSTLSV